MESEQKASAPASQAANGQSFLKRELSGATFLTLEHIAHMALVVIIPSLLLTGLLYALVMWSGASFSGMSGLFMGTNVYSGHAVEAMLAIGVVAALVVLVPALVILDRRTRAEWRKRPNYVGRLAYKAPIYTALAVLGVIVVSLKIHMLYVVLASLAYIGVPNAPIGSMYLGMFLPAAVALLVYGTAFWYVFKLAKGHDYGRRFSLGYGLLGAALAVALFITSIVVMHSDNKTFENPRNIDSSQSIDPFNYDTPRAAPNTSEDYEEFLRNLYR